MFLRIFHYIGVKPIMKSQIWLFPMKDFFYSLFKLLICCFARFPEFE